MRVLKTMIVLCLIAMAYDDLVADKIANRAKKQPLGKLG